MIFWASIFSQSCHAFFALKSLKSMFSRKPGVFFFSFATPQNNIGLHLLSQNQHRPLERPFRAKKIKPRNHPKSKTKQKPKHPVNPKQNPKNTPRTPKSLNQNQIKQHRGTPVPTRSWRQNISSLYSKSCRAMCCQSLGWEQSQLLRLLLGDDLMVFGVFRFFLWSLDFCC